MGATRDCGTLPPPARPTLRLGTLIGSNRTRTEPALKTSVYGEVVYISRPNTYPFLFRDRACACLHLCLVYFILLANAKRARGTAPAGGRASAKSYRPVTVQYGFKL